MGLYILGDSQRSGCQLGGLAGTEDFGERGGDFCSFGQWDGECT